jgi:hypothetical protein
MCISNLKQVTLALQIYVEDYDGHLPGSPRWMDAVRPYTASSDVFQCPTARKDDPAAYGYAFERSLAGRALPNLMSSETKPMVFDSGWLYRSAAGPFKSAVCLPGRHNHKDAVGFADGHVKLVTEGAIHSIISSDRTSAR